MKESAKNGIIAVVFLFLFFYILTSIFKFCTVDGESMENTLQNDDEVIVYTLDKGYSQGNIIVFKSNALEKNLIKRVIAVAGDTVSIANNTVYVNKQPLTEGYAYYTTSNFSDYVNELQNMPETIVPEGFYFVLGDNRYNSTDSRDARVGFVSKEIITGKMVLDLSQWGITGTIMFRLIVVGVAFGVISIFVTEFKKSKHTKKRAKEKMLLDKLSA